MEEKKKKRKELEENLKMGHDIWRPTRRLTWHQIEHLRTLKQTQPDEWSNTKLARFFGISISALVRILRSKFDPPSEVKERQDNTAKEKATNRHAEFKKKFFQSNVGKYKDDEESGITLEGTKATIQGTTDKNIRTGNSTKIDSSWSSSVDERDRTHFRGERNRTNALISRELGVSSNR